ncbi:MAG: squalene/phytoene synthase family protein [Verrucomicrobia bacterium]|nr:squalene/phytoene synthase family protein [Verrucomicrobiota bacterium]
MAETESDLLRSLLRDVSRSFYLTLRALPKSVRPQIGLAYLLARATDTIADTEIVPVDERLEALAQLQARILGSSHGRLDFSRFAAVSGNARSEALSALGSEFRRRSSRGDAERLLLARVEDALTILLTFSNDDRARIRDVLSTITSGQELDLRRFGGSPHAESAGERCKIVALETDAELEDYTYRVAGCVGEFWSKMCRAHLFPTAPLDEKTLLQNGIAFGKGLQLVNIFRDLPADLKLGRCYIPSEKLAEIGLTPSDLLTPKCESRLRPVYDGYLDRAEAYLAAGWTYTNSLPFRCARVRLACAWPLLIGVKTITRLRSANLFQSDKPVKITRQEVRNLIIRSVLLFPMPRLWRGLFEDAKGARPQT